MSQTQTTGAPSASSVPHEDETKAGGGGDGVVVRVRPLTEHEISAGDSEMEWRVEGGGCGGTRAAGTSGSGREGKRGGAVASSTVWLRGERSGRMAERRFRGFERVVGGSVDNAAFFTSVLEARVRAVARGNRLNLFCYGHTGSGKTHTVLGYGRERGMYRHAARTLLSALADMPGGDQYKVSVTFAELYNKQLYDLLNDRAECNVLVGHDGEVHVRAPAVLHKDGRVSMNGLTAAVVTTEEEVVATVERGLAMRKVGSSSLHSRSSRSHALLEMEVVTDKLLELRAVAQARHSELVPVGKRRDDFVIAEQLKQYEKHADGNITVRPDVVIDEDSIAAMNKEVERLEGIVADARRAVADAVAADAVLGGCLVMVDLAGAEHGADGSRPGGVKQSGAERREGKAINTSLLALKECIRARTTSTRRPPFRNSKLTQLLKRHLVPTVGAATVMVANISPSAAHANQAANTLAYASLVGDAFVGRSAPRRKNRTPKHRA